MTPEPTAAVRAALDQRLQVGRTPAVDAAQPVGSGRATGVAIEVSTGPPPVRAGVAAFAARWPLGSLIEAEVLESTSTDRIAARIGGVRVDLPWSRVDGSRPTVGQTLAFRVVAHVPTLTLERVAVSDPSQAANDPDTPMRLSDNALALRAIATSGDAASSGAVRFGQPLFDPTAAASTHADATILLGDASRSDVPARAAIDDLTTAWPVTLPLVLQGPAWPGQPIELVIRREPRDAAIADAALDDWCGDLVLDLPSLGRVAAHLAWSMAGLRVRLDADDGAAAGAMVGDARALIDAFDAASLRVATFSVGRLGVGDMVRSASS